MEATSGHQAAKPRVYFFGVGAYDSAGHYLHSGEGSQLWRRHPDWPRDLPKQLESPDGTLCFRDSAPGYSIPLSVREPEGVARIHLIAGWTAIGWWDRSADKRGACNANFFARGVWRFADLLEEARRQYPRLFARFTYPVVLSGPDVDPDAPSACPKCSSPPAWRARADGAVSYACTAHLGSVLAGPAAVEPLVVEVRQADGRSEFTKLRDEVSNGGGA